MTYIIISFNGGGWQLCRIRLGWTVKGHLILVIQLSLWRWSPLVSRWAPPDSPPTFMLHFKRRYSCRSFSQRRLKKQTRGEANVPWMPPPSPQRRDNTDWNLSLCLSQLHEGDVTAKEWCTLSLKDVHYSLIGPVKPQKACGWILHCKHN